MLAQKKNDYQRDLFKTNLEGMLNHNEPLFRLAQKIDWKKFDTEFGKLYCPDNGRPAKSTRLMVGLHYLKATFNESDETVLDKWVQNVYWQHFCGYQEFQQEAPCDHSTLSRWRKRIKSKGMTFPQYFVQSFLAFFSLSSIVFFPKFDRTLIS